MSEYDEIEKQLNDERNKLLQLEIEFNSIDSDAFFYQKKNDLVKLNELSDKKESLSIQINSQKKVVDELESKFNSMKSKFVEEEKQKEQEIARQKIEKQKQLKKKEEIERFLKKNEANKKRKEQERVQKIDQSKNIRKEWNTGTTVIHNKKTCPKCGAFYDEDSKFCLNCGNRLKTENNHQDENWAVKLFLKKKKEDGFYRFSISKIIGTIYAFLEFCAGLYNFYFPENIIIALIAAALAYLICLIIGFIVRWVYNKYIK